MTMIDLSSPEPKDAELARCYVIHEQNILIAADRWQLPVLPAYMLRQHPHYHYLGLLNGEPCYVCELSNHELDDGSLQPVPLRQLISGGWMSLASRWSAGPCSFSAGKRTIVSAAVVAHPLKRTIGIWQ